MKMRLLNKMFLTLALFGAILIPSGVASALGISPPDITLDPLIPGHKKTVQIDMTRIRTDFVSRIDVNVSDSLQGIVSVTSSDNLIFRYGEKTRKVTIVVDGTSLVDGQELKGTITFKEDKQVNGVEGSTQNLPGVQSNVLLKVSNDQTKLLTVDSTSYAWNEGKKMLRYNYTQRNDRYEDAQVRKINFYFSTVADPEDVITREVLLDANPLKPGEVRSGSGDLVLDSEIAGGVTVSMEFIDQNGATVDKIAPIEIGVNAGAYVKNIKTKRYTLFAVVSLCIAGLFMMDYLYLKRKNRRR